MLNLKFGLEVFPGGLNVEYACKTLNLLNRAKSFQKPPSRLKIMRYKEQKTTSPYNFKGNTKKFLKSHYRGI